MSWKRKGGGGAKVQRGPGKWGKQRGKREGDGDGNEGGGEEPSLHGGSIPLEDIKVSDAWTKRVVYEDVDCGKRKYAMCLGYLGTDFFGSQINPGRRSVEREVERAMLLAGGMVESNFGDLSKIGFTRTARTDKGVHAVSQCLSMKLRLPQTDGHEERFVAHMNDFLPPDVVVHNITRVMGSFHAKNFCSGRVYQYLLPTFLLESESHFQAREGAADFCTTFGGNSMSKMIREFEAVHRDVLLPEDDEKRKLAAAALTRSYYGLHVSQDTLARFRSALTRFVGTRRYHNFTRGIGGKEGQAERYITSFACSDPHMDADGLEWTCLTVHGQSFLLNQIRKMVGLALEVGRGRTALEDMDRCFEATQLADIPRMPGLGLYLGEVDFGLYNGKVRGQNEQFGKGKKSQERIDRRATEADQVAAEEGADSAAAAAAQKAKATATPPNAVDELDFGSQPTCAARMTSFREGQVWPHVAATEVSSRHFIMYHAFAKAVVFVDSRVQWNRPEMKRITSTTDQPEAAPSAADDAPAPAPAPPVNDDDDAAAADADAVADACANAPSASGSST